MKQGVENPDVVSLAAGLVDPASLPVKESRIAVEKLLSDEKRARQVLQYGTTPGAESVRRVFLRHFAGLEGAEPDALGVDVNQMILTTGSQQLLSLVGETLLDPEDICLVAAPTYFVFIGLLNGLGARAIPVATDDNGMRMDALEETLEQIERDGELDRVKLIYLVSDYENPSGISLSADRREQAVDIARRWSKNHRLLILEDAAYRELRYDGPNHPSVWSFDESHEYVILSQTFSKTYSPGIRVGYGVVPNDLVLPICDRKGNEDFGSANFNQHLIATVIEEGLYDQHVVEVCDSSLSFMLKAHCAQCHNRENDSGGLDFSRIDSNLQKAESLRRWVLIHDRIAAGEMPPREAQQPERAAKRRSLATLAAALTTADRKHRTVVLRRLNRNEYENTVRDLFGIHVQVRELLPKDGSTSGFDNVGAGLSVSAEALKAYLEAADVVLDAVFGPPKPPKRIDHKTNLLDQKTHDGKPYLSRQIGKMFRKTKDGLVIFQSGYCPTNLVNFARLRAPAGTYRGSIRVRAIQTRKPVTLRIYAGDTIVGRRERHLVGYYDVPPGKWTTIRFTDRLVESGGTFQPKCYGTIDTRKNADTYPAPGIEIGDIHIEGPLEAWPPPSRAKLLGDVDLKRGTLKDAKAILARLLPRAFRRTASSEELKPYVAVVGKAMKQGRSFENALRVGLKAVLCSPQFLFLDEPGRDRVSDFALASRLSYFLWSSMPDDALLAAAAKGKLSDPAELRRQTERLLSDPKSRAFTTNFTGQWLNLREIDFTSPDQKLYPEFDELLKISMVEETHRYFREMIDRNIDLMKFVDSDFTFLNERLAKHYGISGVDGQTFRKVKLPADSVRGGVITQASVLKVTANGTNTSPVMRGVWVLENILGRPVPPPPSNVPAIEPDIRGATTLRLQLAKHRNVQSCAVCHVKIDPPGFALENFDVIGGWRDNYRTLGTGKRPGFSRSPFTHAWVRFRIGLPVDAKGKTAKGQSFRDIREFKRILLREQTQIATGMTNKLITYAIGRVPGFSDRSAVGAIVDRVASQGNGYRTLIHEVVQSQLFRQP
eukprot:g8421.t1